MKLSPAMVRVLRAVREGRVYVDGQGVVREVTDVHAFRPGITDTVRALERRGLLEAPR